MVPITQGTPYAQVVATTWCPQAARWPPALPSANGYEASAMLRMSA